MPDVNVGQENSASVDLQSVALSTNLEETWCTH
jgi:hypothetical protein